MKKFFATMHHNTIDELITQGESLEKAERTFDFNSIKEALDFNYPFHKDQYILNQWDLNSEQENGTYDLLASCYIGELTGDEITLED